MAPPSACAVRDLTGCGRIALASLVSKRSELSSEHSDMSWPGIEPGPPAREASTLEKSHLDSLSAGYSEPLLGLGRNIRPLQYTICMCAKTIVSNKNFNLLLGYLSYDFLFIYFLIMRRITNPSPFL